MNCSVVFAKEAPLLDEPPLVHDPLGTPDSVTNPPGGNPPQAPTGTCPVNQQAAHPGIGRSSQALSGSSTRRRRWAAWSPTWRESATCRLSACCCSVPLLVCFACLLNCIYLQRCIPDSPVAPASSVSLYIPCVSLHIPCIALSMLDTC